MLFRSTYVGAKVEIAVCNNDGSSPTVWGSCIDYQGFGAAKSNVGGRISGADISVSAGQRLRIRAYLDQRFTAQTPEEQRRLVDGWIAGVRQRADVLDLYADAPAAR